MDQPGLSNILCYPAELIDDIWDEAAPLIQRALDRGSHYTIEDIYMGLQSKQMQLWTWNEDGIKACLVTAIQITDVTYCLLLAIGGEYMHKWFPYFYLVEDWARENGAKEMRIYGRIGWAKLTGYEVCYTKMRKSL